MEWLDDYNIGIEKIDKQHQKLAFLISKIKDDLMDVDCKTDEKYRERIIFSILPNLVEYTKEHFKDEEEFMKEINYPRLPNQQKLHEKFVNQIKDILVTLRSGKHYSSTFLYKSLTNWLLTHILFEDRKIGEYYKSNK